MMSPEESMRIQKAINSDIVMQLDDVVSGFFTKPNASESSIGLHTLISFRRTQGFYDNFPIGSDVLIYPTSRLSIVVLPLFEL